MSIASNKVHVIVIRRSVYNKNVNILNNLHVFKVCMSRSFLSCLQHYYINVPYLNNVHFIPHK